MAMAAACPTVKTPCSRPFFEGELSKGDALQSKIYVSGRSTSVRLSLDSEISDGDCASDTDDEDIVALSAWSKPSDIRVDDTYLVAGRASSSPILSGKFDSSLMKDGLEVFPNGSFKVDGTAGNSWSESDHLGYPSPSSDASYGEDLIINGHEKLSLPRKRCRSFDGFAQPRALAQSSHRTADPYNISDQTAFVSKKQCVSCSPPHRHERSPSPEISDKAIGDMVPVRSSRLPSEADSLRSTEAFLSELFPASLEGSFDCSDLTLLARVSLKVREIPEQEPQIVACGIVYPSSANLVSSPDPMQFSNKRSLHGMDANLEPLLLMDMASRVKLRSRKSSYSSDRNSVSMNNSNASDSKSKDAVAFVEARHDVTGLPTCRSDERTRHTKKKCTFPFLSSGRALLSEKKGLKPQAGKISFGTVARSTTTPLMCTGFPRKVNNIRVKKSLARAKNLREKKNTGSDSGVPFNYSKHSSMALSLTVSQELAKSPSRSSLTRCLKPRHVKLGRNLNSTLQKIRDARRDLLKKRLEKYKNGIPHPSRVLSNGRIFVPAPQSDCEDHEKNKNALALRAASCVIREFKVCIESIDWRTVNPPLIAIPGEPSRPSISHAEIDATTLYPELPFAAAIGQQDDQKSTASSRTPDKAQPCRSSKSQRPCRSRLAKEQAFQLPAYMKGDFGSCTPTEARSRCNSAESYSLSNDKLEVLSPQSCEDLISTSPCFSNLGDSLSCSKFYAYPRRSCRRRLNINADACAEVSKKSRSPSTQSAKISNAEAVRSCHGYVLKAEPEDFGESVVKQNLMDCKLFSAGKSNSTLGLLFVDCVDSCVDDIKLKSSATNNAGVIEDRAPSASKSMETHLPFKGRNADLATLTSGRANVEDNGVTSAELEEKMIGDNSCSAATPFHDSDAPLPVAQSRSSGLTISALEPSHMQLHSALDTHDYSLLHRDSLKNSQPANSMDAHVSCAVSSECSSPAVTANLSVSGVTRDGAQVPVDHNLLAEKAVICHTQMKDPSPSESPRNRPYECANESADSKRIVQLSENLCGISKEDACTSRRLSILHGQHSVCNANKVDRACLCAGIDVCSRCTDLSCSQLQDCVRIAAMENTSSRKTCTMHFIENSASAPERGTLSTSVFSSPLHFPRAETTAGRSIVTVAEDRCRISPLALTPEKTVSQFPDFSSGKRKRRSLLLSTGKKKTHSPLGQLLSVTAAARYKSLLNSPPILDSAFHRSAKSVSECTGGFDLIDLDANSFASVRKRAFSDSSFRQVSPILHFAESFAQLPESSDESFRVADSVPASIDSESVNDAPTDDDLDEAFQREKSSLSDHDRAAILRGYPLKELSVDVIRIDLESAQQLIQLCRHRANWHMPELLKKAGLSVYDSERLHLKSLRCSTADKGKYCLRRFIKKKELFQPAGPGVVNRVQELDFLKSDEVRQKELLRRGKVKERKQRELESIRRSLASINRILLMQSSFWDFAVK